MFVALWFFVCALILAIGLSFLFFAIRHHLQIDKLKSENKT